MKVFFIPYAGGSANSYRVFRKYLDPKIEMVLVELAGRGERKHESFYEDINEAVEDIINKIRDKIDDEPYSIFGHSMGGLIIYELLGEIEKLGIHYPKHVFISARRAPHLKSLYGKKYHKLPDKEFVFELSKLGDMNREFSKQPNLFKIFLPIIRADYKLVEEYVFNRPIKKLRCNMSLFYAIDDIETSKEEVLQWREYAGKEVECFEFQGGHFYLFANMGVVSNVINNTFDQYIN
jgi:surfactin synthase thioesterase subunit